MKLCESSASLLGAVRSSPLRKDLLSLETHPIKEREYFTLSTGIVSVPQNRTFERNALLRDTFIAIRLLYSGLGICLSERVSLVSLRFRKTEIIESLKRKLSARLKCDMVENAFCFVPICSHIFASSSGFPFTTLRAFRAKTMGELA